MESKNKLKHIFILKVFSQLIILIVIVNLRKEESVDIFQISTRITSSYLLHVESGERTDVPTIFLNMKLLFIKNGVPRVLSKVPQSISPRLTVASAKS